MAEFALTIVLLVGAGLPVRSWWHVNGIDPGVSPERILVMELSSPTTFSVPAQRADLYHRVLEQMQAVPGVESADIIGDLFIANTRDQVVTIERDDGLTSERLPFRTDEVSTDFLQDPWNAVARRPLLCVRRRARGSPVAIVNDAMARRAWPGHDPVGRRF